MEISGEIFSNGLFTVGFAAEKIQVLLGTEDQYLWEYEIRGVYGDASGKVVHQEEVIGLVEKIMEDVYEQFQTVVAPESD